MWDRCDASGSLEPFSPPLSSHCSLKTLCWSLSSFNITSVCGAHTVSSLSLISTKKNSSANALSLMCPRYALSANKRMELIFNKIFICW